MNFKYIVFIQWNIRFSGDADAWDARVWGVCCNVFNERVCIATNHIITECYAVVDRVVPNDVAGLARIVQQ